MALVTIMQGACFKTITISTIHLFLQQHTLVEITGRKVNHCIIASMAWVPYLKRISGF